MKKLFSRKQKSTEELRQNPSITQDKQNSPRASAGETAMSSLPSAEQVPKRKFFGFLERKNKTDPAPGHPNGGQTRDSELSGISSATEKTSLLPGSDGEHRLQEQYGTKSRALNFYDKQVLDYLAPAMRDFIARQEFLFVATADRHGECDCTSKFGEPGFIRVLGEKHLMYPEYRGNGVYANAGNIQENPHIAMLIIDFYRDAVGLHVNGRARVVENEELLACSKKLPKNVIEEISLEGKRRPERWVMVEVEEAYIQCSKHIPQLQKRDRKIQWGTDSVAEKKGDYFQLSNIPLYNRLGGDKAMEKVVDVFYRKVLQDELVGRFFEDVDMVAQRVKQKSFLAMAFGGPYQYTELDLRKIHAPMVENLGLADAHFDRVAAILRETLDELEISKPEIDEVMAIIESTRDVILNR